MTLGDLRGRHTTTRGLMTLGDLRGSHTTTRGLMTLGDLRGRPHHYEGSDDLRGP